RRTFNMNRETFFQKPDKPRTIDIPLEGGRTVKARKLTQAEVETLTKRYATPDKALEGLRYTVCRTVVDDDGERVFSDEDQARMADVDFDVIQAVASGVVGCSGLGERDAKGR